MVFVWKESVTRPEFDIGLPIICHSFLISTWFSLLDWKCLFSFRMPATLINKIFCNSDKDKFPVIFLILYNVPTTTGIMLILKCYLFLTSFSRSLYFEWLSNSFAEMFFFYQIIKSIRLDLCSLKYFMAIYGFLNSGVCSV